MLACSAHRGILALELERFGGAAFAQEEQPRAVDGPVAQRAGAGEVQGAWGEGVGEVVADCCWGEVLALGDLKRD